MEPDEDENERRRGNVYSFILFIQQKQQTGGQDYAATPIAAFPFQLNFTLTS